MATLKFRDENGAWQYAPSLKYKGTTWAKAPSLKYKDANGVWHKVSIVGRGSSSVCVNPVFANNTWQQIIESCQTNNVPETWLVGDQKTMTINGVDYTIDIIGKNHDTYTTGGTAPLTFQMHDCYNTTYRMNPTATNSGGWANCAMRTSSLTSVMTLLPAEVQNAIREVNKSTSAGYASTTISTTADKLFLLSEIEVFGALRYTYAGEGEQYAYYAAGNSARKTVNGTAAAWWCRSPYASQTIQFALVNSTGTAADSDDADSNNGLSFAFCF